MILFPSQIVSISSRCSCFNEKLGQDILLHRIYEVGAGAAAVSSHCSSLACPSFNHVSLSVFDVSVLFVAETVLVGEALLSFLFPITSTPQLS